MTDIPNSPLPQRTLGRTGASVTALGLGGAGLHGVYGPPIDDATAIECVQRSIELGVQTIDTSPLYGESERRIGLALQGGYREKVYLATKTGTGAHPKDFSRDGTYRSIERSLERLQTDFIDLVHIHDPDDLAPTLASGGALEALLNMKGQGVIGAIGLGVRSHAFLLEAIRHGAFDAVLTYSDFNLVRQTAREALFGEAESRGVGILLGSPLLYGYLSDRPWDELLKRLGVSDETEEQRKALEIRRWAEKRGVSVLRLAIQYCLREPRISVVLVGASTASEMEQNVEAAVSPLPEEVWEALADEVGIE
jgi:aryl-alcohol dehydrogenase-like predicted oxidoreductase